MTEAVEPGDFSGGPVATLHPGEAVPEPVRGVLPVKLSSPATREFWEIEVLFEDADLFAINKPAGLLSSPDRYDPTRPNLMRLLHEGIQKGTPWAASRGLTYLSNAHRLDFETTGVFLLAKNKPALVRLAEQFGAEKPRKVYLALVQGNPANAEFTVDVPLAPDLRQPGRMRCSGHGKKSITHFKVLEQFRGTALVECRPVTGRTHQLRVHLQHAGHPIRGDAMYGGKPLYLSSIKPNFRAKGGEGERPLTPTLALHAAQLAVTQPTTGELVVIEAGWPKDLRVAMKYLRRYGR